MDKKKSWFRLTTSPKKEQSSLSSILVEGNELKPVWIGIQDQVRYEIEIERELRKKKTKLFDDLDYDR